MAWISAAKLAKTVKVSLKGTLAAWLEIRCGKQHRPERWLWKVDRLPADASQHFFGSR